MKQKNQSCDSTFEDLIYLTQGNKGKSMINYSDKFRLPCAHTTEKK